MNAVRNLVYIIALFIGVTGAVLCAAIWTSGFILPGGVPKGAPANAAPASCAVAKFLHWTGAIPLPCACIDSFSSLIDNGAYCANTPSCPDGKHIEGSLCIPDGFHSAGGTLACRDGTHRDHDVCVPDGQHWVKEGRTCDDGYHYEPNGTGHNECIRDGSK